MAQTKEEKRAYMREWHAKNKERVAAGLRRRYAEDPEYRDRVKRQNNSAYARNPQKSIDAAKRYYRANKEARKLKISEWASRNPDRVNRYTAAYRSTNREICNARSRTWAAANAGRLDAARKNWARLNPDRIRELRINYRAKPENMEREKRLRGLWQAANQDKIRKQGRIQANRRRARLQNCSGACSFDAAIGRASFHGWRCVYCRVELTESTLTIDHMVPITRGGSNWPSNIAPACKSCNSRKHKRTYSEYVKILRSRDSQCTLPLPS